MKFSNYGHNSLRNESNMTKLATDVQHPLCLFVKVLISFHVEVELKLPLIHISRIEQSLSSFERPTAPYNCNHSK